ncbi:hypothetical protein SISNIDRAFT_498993 [Sistotremastrum niveocremeum HHB9708]|uniref:Uncharacterized protein n=1 Tax=Sistotremastrum niveocremeum HHB9708 TaxID=1314777 RepID=A0A165ACA8_9AGAM|nr:hypothetical protein SISNIDRAFT_498993 [Sistotremastrum niveocremeum HHB9708]
MIIWRTCNNGPSLRIQRTRTLSAHVIRLELGWRQWQERPLNEEHSNSGGKAVSMIQEETSQASKVLGASSVVRSENATPWQICQQGEPLLPTLCSCENRRVVWVFKGRWCCATGGSGRVGCMVNRGGAGVEYFWKERQLETMQAREEPAIRAVRKQWGDLKARRMLKRATSSRFSPPSFLHPPMSLPLPASHLSPQLAGGMTLSHRIIRQKALIEDIRAGYRTPVPPMDRCVCTGSLHVAIDPVLMRCAVPHWLLLQLPIVNANPCALLLVSNVGCL